MNPDAISRRCFVAAGAGLAASAQNSGGLTAKQVIERIQANVGISWRAQTVDGIVFGNPDAAVKGIATTMMATLDVVERAAATGKNMVVTHEPTFYSHQDKTDTLTEDVTYRYKADFLRRHDMVVFHFHDHWHGRRPDGIAAGMARELGWEKNADPEEARLFRFPGTPLVRFARDIASKLKIRTMRILGDPHLPVKRVLASWGNVSLVPGVPYFSRPDVDVLVVGETREWELVEYAQDTIRSGKQKALVVLGHVVSEQAGMKLCAEWLRSFIHEVPIEFIPATEPFWSPDSPVG